MNTLEKYEKIKSQRICRKRKSKWYILNRGITEISNINFKSENNCKNEAITETEIQWMGSSAEWRGQTEPLNFTT